MATTSGVVAGVGQLEEVLGCRQGVPFAAIEVGAGWGDQLGLDFGSAPDAFRSSMLWR